MKANQGSYSQVYKWRRYAATHKQRSFRLGGLLEFIWP